MLLYLLRIQPKTEYIDLHSKIQIRFGPSLPVQCQLTAVSAVLSYPVIHKTTLSTPLIPPISISVHSDYIIPLRLNLFL